MRSKEQRARDIERTWEDIERNLEAAWGAARIRKNADLGEDGQHYTAGLTTIIAALIMHDGQRWLRLRVHSRHGTASLNQCAWLVRCFAGAAARGFACEAPDGQDAYVFIPLEQDPLPPTPAHVVLSRITP
jgi:hypothetical protein